VWPTTNGLRCLAGDEGELVRGAIGMMLDHLVAEGREGDPQNCYGIEWFDQWDSQQRIWLLEHLTLALLTDVDPPSPAAIWEATIDAIFQEIYQLVELEIAGGAGMAEPNSWRQCVIEAFVAQHEREPGITFSETDINSWHMIITQLADTILGVRLYQQAESFRDGEIEQTQKFLRQKGLPDDFLEQIPPLRTVDQTQRSIDQIQALVCR
jgi:hypothetical protein